MRWKIVIYYRTLLQYYSYVYMFDPTTEPVCMNVYSIKAVKILPQREL